MKLSQIKLDTGLQMRAQMNQHVVDDYCDAILAGSKFPPIILFHDGTDYHLADGWTRYFAHKKAGLEIIDADVRQGTRRDALEFAVGANATNGQCRTPEDKRKAVLTVMDDFEWAERSDREIARMCNVSHVFVSRLRKAAGKQPDTIKSIQNGKEVPMRSLKKELEDESNPSVQYEEKVNELATTIQELAEENKALEARVAISQMGQSSNAEKEAHETLARLQAENKLLEADKRVLGSRCDSLQAEAVEIKKQSSYWERRAKKAEKELESAHAQLKSWKDRAETAEAHLAINAG